MHVRRVALLVCLASLLSLPVGAANISLTGTPAREMEQLTFSSDLSEQSQIYQSLIAAGILCAEDVTLEPAALVEKLIGSAPEGNTNQELVHALCSALDTPAPDERAANALMQFSDFGFIHPAYRADYAYIAPRLVLSDSFLHPTQVATKESLLPVITALHAELFAKFGFSVYEGQVTESSAMKNNRTVKLSSQSDTITLKIAANERVALIRDGSADLFEGSLRAGDRVTILTKDGDTLAITVASGSADSALTLWRARLYYCDVPGAQIVFTDAFREENGNMVLVENGFYSMQVAPAVLCFHNISPRDWRQLNMTALDRTVTLLTNEKNQIVYINMEEGA
ncbi:MAG: hypothetical protein E7409_00325 [Ruminococcaceae bacterium]|nr:hypothetical protein [Oscillospiraceae bacterium]